MKRRLRFPLDRRRTGQDDEAYEMTAEMETAASMTKPSFGAASSYAATPSIDSADFFADPDLLKDLAEFMACDADPTERLPRANPVFRERLRNRLWQILSMKRVAKLGSLH